MKSYWVHLPDELLILDAYTREVFLGIMWYNNNSKVHLLYMEKIHWVQIIKNIFLSYPLIYDCGTALKNFVFKGPSWKEIQEAVFHRGGHLSGIWKASIPCWDMLLNLYMSLRLVMHSIYFNCL